MTCPLFAGSTEVEYLEAWDIIVIGDGPAALRASASAAKAGASTLMMSADGLGAGNNSALDGIAAPLKVLPSPTGTIRSELGDFCATKISFPQEFLKRQDKSIYWKDGEYFP